MLKMLKENSTGRRWIASASQTLIRKFV